MLRRSPILIAAVIMAATLTSSLPVSAQGKKSGDVVKVSAKADKPDGEGKQAVTIEIGIDPKWHIYANPAGNDLFTTAETKVTVTGKNKLEEVKVAYPEGKVIKDKTTGDYKVYEERVTIKADVRRAKGDTGPLEVSVEIQACSDKQCLLPATVKVNVP